MFAQFRVDLSEDGAGRRLHARGLRISHPGSLLECPLQGAKHRGGNHRLNNARKGTETVPSLYVPRLYPRISSRFSFMCP